MTISFVIPVYNRPDELHELLQSLVQQTADGVQMEAIVVEDGSTLRADVVIGEFTDQMNLKYFYKENSGPGDSRNYGARHATGDYIIVLDSDCVLPQSYLQHVARFIEHEQPDAFGGPDRAADNFTTTQKAINYSMTSFLTTGGIRGGRKRIDRYYPRSFNMGVRSSVWHAHGGFANMRYGEDIDFSIRLWKTGCKVCLIEDAWVWHKRRATLRQFYRQVSQFGAARKKLGQLHPDTFRFIHLLPTLFVIGLLLCLLAAPFTRGAALLPPLLLALIILVDALRQTRSTRVALTAVAASYVQLCGYGLGFLRACLTNR